MKARYRQLPKAVCYVLVYGLILFGVFGWWQEIRADGAGGDVGNDSVPQNAFHLEKENHQGHHRHQPLPWQPTSATQAFAEQPEIRIAESQRAEVDCTKVACIALTFDDGPEPTATNVLLDSLAKHQAVATFFLIGNRAAAHPSLVKRMVLGGNEIGNHSFAHPFLTKIPPEQIDDQVAKAQQAIVAAGAPAPIAMRPPYGAMNKTVTDRVNMPLVLWNVDPHDWAEKDPNKIALAVTSQAKQGCILLLHERPTTAAAMDAILSDLQKRFVLVTVNKLLGLKPESRGQFFSQYTSR